MKILSKAWIRTGIACMCTLLFIFSGIVVKADDIEDKENQLSNLQEQMTAVNQELLEIAGEIADVEDEIAETAGEIEKTQEQLAIARNSESQQYENLKLRIKYMYENDDMSLLEALISADSMQEFLNGVEFIQNIVQYDRDMLEELSALEAAITEQEEHLAEEQEAKVKLKQQLSSRQADLQAKADAMSVDVSSLQTTIQKLRAEEAKKAAEEAQKKAEAEAAAAAAAAQAQNSANQSASAGSSSSSASASSGSGYIMPSGDGVLTKEKGVNYYNGHKETYYSQRVLPGYGLNIPGRHVAEDGTIRDIDNYICVASSDYPKGTIVQTSLGPGKVYDSGCAPGTIDIYTDW